MSLASNTKSSGEQDPRTTTQEATMATEVLATVRRLIDLMVSQIFIKKITFLSF